MRLQPPQRPEPEPEPVLRPKFKKITKSCSYKEADQWVPPIREWGWGQPHRLMVASQNEAWPHRMWCELPKWMMISHNEVFYVEKLTRVMRPNFSKKLHYEQNNCQTGLEPYDLWHQTLSIKLLLNDEMFANLICSNINRFLWLIELLECWMLAGLWPAHIKVLALQTLQRPFVLNLRIVWRTYRHTLLLSYIDHLNMNSLKY